MNFSFGFFVNFVNSIIVGTFIVPNEFVNLSLKYSSKVSFFETSSISFLIYQFLHPFLNIKGKLYETYWR